MNINKSNYEEYIIDYLDGKLPAGMLDELLLFLEANPEIKEELELIKDSQLEADSKTVFPNKEWLKKSDDDTNEFYISTDDNIAIAALEGDLKGKDLKKFEKRISDDHEFSKNYLYFTSTKLKPTAEIQMPGKQFLKKQEVKEFGFINSTNYELVFAAYFEGDLSAGEIEELETFISLNPGLAEEFEIFSGIKIPVPHIPFPEKSLLRKQGGIRSMITSARFASAIAASMALLITVSLFLQNETHDTRLINHRTTAKGELQAVITNEIISEKEFTPDMKTRTLKASTNTEKHSSFNKLETKPQATLAVLTTEPELINDNRNYYSSLYYDLQLVNELLADNISSGEKSQTTTLAQYGRSRLFSFLNLDTDEDLSESATFSWWDVADMSIAGINKLTSTDIRLSRDQDKGVSSFAISGGRFEIGRKKTKP